MTAAQKVTGGPAGEGEDIVRTYLDEIGRRPLLDKSREQVLGRAVQAGLAARRVLDEAANTKVALPERERRALRRAVRDGEGATTEFVESNLRLVVSIAKRYRHSGVPFLDLIQDGNIGLLHAVELFDPAKGFKFSTYATWWIRQAISRGLANTSRLIRFPNHANDLMRRHDRMLEDLQDRLHRSPTRQELADEMHMDIRALSRLLDSGQVVTSTDTVVNDDGDLTVGDLAAVSDDDADEHLNEVTMREQVRRSLNALDARERQILEMRHGFVGGKTHTLAEVGAHFGLTRERIRQIEIAAIAKLRQGDQRRRLEALIS